MAVTAVAAVDPASGVAAGVGGIRTVTTTAAWWVGVDSTAAGGGGGATAVAHPIPPSSKNSRKMALVCMGESYW